MSSNISIKVKADARERALCAQAPHLCCARTRTLAARALSLALATLHSKQKLLCLADRFLRAIAHEANETYTYDNTSKYYNYDKHC